MQKILVTIGPASIKEEIITELAKHNLYLLRINLSHTDLNDLEDFINTIKSKTDIPICLDSEGAQIRNQKMENGSTYFEKDSVVKVHYDGCMGDPCNISFTPVGIAKDFVVGDVIFIDFDSVSIMVIEKNRNYCMAKVLQPGIVGSNKAADLNRDFCLPSLTEKDRQAFKIGKEMGVRNFALSFANTKYDVEMVKTIVGKDSDIISKIESKAGLANLKDILEVTDEILIDRGDLSRQVSIEKIPFLQRRIISLARIYDKPVYVATNLLESMVKSRNPSRAEVNDIVSTILMGSDGLVLAAETAIGSNPLLAVEVVAKIIKLCRKWTPNTNISEILEM